MGKKTRNRAAAVADAGENPRRPCPCGSGKRYKNCHGAGDDVIVIRPFEGLAAEPDLIAMREFLPSATAELPLRSPGEKPVTLASVLPGASAALVRDDGEGTWPRTWPGRWPGRPRPSPARRCRSSGRGSGRRSACRTCSTPTPRST
jgi:hypothetical protein